jgi:hypothetical protein
MSDATVQPVAEPVAGLSQWQRVFCIFTAPSKTFNDIKAGHKSWWLPFLIYVLLGYLFFGAVYTKIGMRQAVENQIHLSPKSEAQMANLPPDRRETQMKIAVYVTEGIFLATPVFLLLGVAVLSLGLWGTINFGFGGKATFGSIFTAWMYAALPSVIKTLLGIVVIYAGTAPESFNLKNFAPTNVAAFLSPTDTNAALYKLLTSVDVITIWTLVLLGIGTAIVAGVKRSSGYIAVFGWWILFVLIGVGWAAAFGS